MRKWLVMLIFALFLGAEGAQASKRIVVDLSKQEAYAYEDGRLVFSGWVSTGRPGRRTPPGHYRVLEKARYHVSSKYPEPHGGAVMNYMLRLTDYGIAMHLGYVPNYPASHGCIRMENGFAQKMYSWATVGTPVLVRGTPPRSIDRPLSHYSFRTASSGFSDEETSYVGKDPLKFLSTVPGKRLSEKKKKKIAKVKRRVHRRKRHSKTVLAQKRKEPMTPLAMLRD